MIRCLARVALALSLMWGCGEASDTPGPGTQDGAPSEAAAGGPPSAVEETTTTATALRVDTVDLLFMLDNSYSMRDKQEILKVAVPDLLSRLINPRCVDADGNEFPSAPAGEPCPAGQEREFESLVDLHVGVVSSSLGDGGADVECPVQGHDGYRPDRVDMAHLMGSLPRGRNPGSNAAGFLQWQAGRTLPSGFERDLQQMVADVGDQGCGFESSLESWYRFLVDPFPFSALERVACSGAASSQPNCVRPVVDADGRIALDSVLLAQRAQFLRPESLLLIIMLTDENDCSAIVGGENWFAFALDRNLTMFRGSSACEQNPNDQCCYTCPAGPPPGCTADAICNADPATGAQRYRLPADLDGHNLRCFDQKRRFGVDLLYPIRRYVNALREPSICWNAPDLGLEGCAGSARVDNPLFQGGRPADRVFLAGILGVPWQAIAANVDAAGRPLQADQLRFQNARELRQNDTWSRILGLPGTPWQPATETRAEIPGSPPIPPSLAQMVESMQPRPGILDGNPINGREHATQFAQMGPPDDLEYACIFPLATPRDCSVPQAAIEGCNCSGDGSDTALCEQAPGVTPAGSTQYWAKAYPSLRPLEVLRDYGDNSILASICARNVVDPAANDFGYRPAMAAIVERLRAQLR